MHPYLECGGRPIQPRPFLRPVDTATVAEGVARGVSTAAQDVVAAMRRFRDQMATLGGIFEEETAHEPSVDVLMARADRALWQADPSFAAELGIWKPELHERDRRLRELAAALGAVAKAGAIRLTDDDR